MIRLKGIASHNHKDADDEKQAVNNSPPSKGGEVAIREVLSLVCLNLSDDARDEGDEPGKLRQNLLADVDAIVQELAAAKWHTPQKQAQDFG
jgi:hypothetical protein